MSLSGSAGLRRRGGEQPFLPSQFRARGLAGLRVENGAARRNAEGRLRPPPAVVALLIGPAAAAATGPAVRPPTGCRRRRSGGPGRLAGPGRPAGGSGRGLGGEAAAAEGRVCPPGPGGCLPRSPLPWGDWPLGPASPGSQRGLGVRTTEVERGSDSLRLCPGVAAEAEAQPHTFHLHVLRPVPRSEPPLLTLACLCAAL